METPPTTTPTQTQTPTTPTTSKRGMLKSPSSWKLSSLTPECDHDDDDDRDDDDETLSATDSEEDHGASTAELTEAAQLLQRRKRALSLSLSKPPRHQNMPIYVQSVLRVWKRVLQRDDVSVLDDFFHDLGGSDAQAWELVEQMQSCVGVAISIQQLCALRRCCIYSVLMTAL